MKALVALAVLSLTLTGCAPVAEPTGSPSQSVSPSESATPSPSPTETPIETASIEVFFVTDTPKGLRLASETREYAKGDQPLETQVLSDLISGAVQPADHDYSNLWDSSNALNSVTVSGSRARIDLKLGKLNVGAEAEARAIDQLVYTLTSLNPKVRRVSIVVNGKVVESLAGHVDTTHSFSRRDEINVLMSVQISSVLDGGEVESPVTVTGAACTYEAQVAWALRSAGKVIQRGTTRAKTACPNRSAWSIELGALDPGTYTLGVSDFSAKDGSLVSRDNKTFTVK